MSNEKIEYEGIFKGCTKTPKQIMAYAFVATLIAGFLVEYFG